MHRLRPTASVQQLINNQNKQRYQHKHKTNKQTNTHTDSKCPSSDHVFFKKNVFFLFSCFSSLCFFRLIKPSSNYIFITNAFFPILSSFVPSDDWPAGSFRSKFFLSNTIRLFLVTSGEQVLSGFWFLLSNTVTSVCRLTSCAG